jgi:TonB-dependent starch-binding outer membrane protein SusC
MKLTTALLLAGFLQVSAKGVSQTVTLSEKHARLETIFREIRQQTGYEFLYNSQMLADAKWVDIQVANASVEDALRISLRDQPFTYVIREKTIVITPKPPTVTRQPGDALAEPPPPAEIHGRIMDSLGNPLAGASVMIKGSKKGAMTDARGDFELKEVGDNVVLVISFTGYLTREYHVKDYTNKFYVPLSRSNSPLDQVQVIAYGTGTRRFSVGSVSTVTSEDIEKQPVTNVLLALEGRVPGLTIDPSNGSPGSLQLVQVRGQNTLGSTPSLSPFDQPLFIVDGVPFAPQNQNINAALMNNLGGTNYNVPNSGFSPLNSINPSDVESISVLKDADATSIYGSQGANGVIVITTKKGKAGATSLNVRVNTGPNKTTRELKMLNTPQYLQMRRQAVQNDGLTLDPTSYYDTQEFPDLLIYDSTQYHDFAKQFFGGTSNNTDAHVSLSGGSQSTTFIVSAGYTRSVYDFPGNFADNRGTLHSGMHHTSQDHRLNIDFGSDFSYDRNNTSSAPSVAQAMLMAPNTPDLLDPAGNLVWSYKGANLSSYQLLAFLKQPFSLQSYNWNNSARIGYQLAPGLNISAGAGYSMIYTNQYSATPLASQAPGTPNANATFDKGDYQTLNLEPQLDYKRRIGKGQLSALVGSTYKKSTSSDMQVMGSGYTDDAFIGSIAGAATITASNTATIYKYTGVYGRLGYIYDGEYIVNLTGRRDGSSNFGPNRQFGNFASAGLGWIFSEERAFKNALPFVSYAKIAGNYGTNGSDGVAAYMYQPFWKIANTYTYPLFQGTRPYQPNNLYNPDYSWASKHAVNLSLDLGFLHDRLLLNVTGYRNRTSNQLTSYTLPSQTGFTGVIENFNATVQDAGLEVSIGTVNIKTKNFRWSTSFNISGNRNKLLAFPGLATSSYATDYTIGKPTSIQYGFKYKGVNDTTGVFQFATGKGGLTSAPSYVFASQGGDMQPIADIQPKYFGGLGNTFSYKGWSLTLFFQYAKQIGHNYLFGVYTGGSSPGAMSNLPAELTGFWQKPGDKATLERLTTGDYNANPLGFAASQAGSYFTSSSGSYGDASYIRLKTLSLSYALPAPFLKKVGVKGCNVYVNAQNLLTFTGYKFGDPEMKGILYTVPLQRTVAGGLSFDF